ncbi:MAG: hypothetical protein AAGL11_09765 [Pseudomonadota bacterium]
MAERSNMIEQLNPEETVSLEEAISQIESGEASETITVDIGHDRLVRADGAQGLQGLLQRLRGHRMVLALSSGEATSSVVAMRSGRPELHPDVAEILDALKDQG